MRRSIGMVMDMAPPAKGALVVPARHVCTMRMRLEAVSPPCRTGLSSWEFTLDGRPFSQRYSWRGLELVRPGILRDPYDPLGPVYYRRCRPPKGRGQLDLF
jgi:hypothetical protein